MTTRRIFIPLLWLVLGLSGGAGLAAAPGVVINEIMYHPVEEPAFNADGTPVFNLYEEIFEFVELHNPGTAAVSLEGWRLSGGIEFTFPASAQIAAGGYLVVAKDPVRLRSIGAYQLAALPVLGPYAGQLSNRGEAIRLRDSTGQVVDAVSYSASFPWPAAADALGADEEWTGFKPENFQYRGRSLERVSATWNSQDPSNWLASPAPGNPSPGRKNAQTREVPLPVVVHLRHSQASDGAAIIRPDQQARVELLLSHTNGIAGIRLEYFADNIEVSNEPISIVNAVPQLNAGHYLAMLPGAPSRTILRYRVMANFGSGFQQVSPRPSDPLKWHGYLVTPVRSGANPQYDLFVSQASLNRLVNNINQTPRRVTAAAPSGMIRTNWNATEPAIFAHQGEIWEAQIRYHGSRYRRSAGRKSYKLKFPRYHKFNQHDSVFITDKTFDTVAGHKLFREAGIPTSETRWVDWYFNSEGRLLRLEQEEYGGDLLDRHYRDWRRLHPQDPEVLPGELYKCVGNDDPDGLEGPFGKGDGRLLPPLPPYWTALQRYEHTYSLQNHGWRGPLEIKTMFDRLWAARGDSPMALNPAPNVPALRQFFEAHFDVDSLLTYMAVQNWMSPWDDVVHNHGYWQQRNGKWSMIPWDFDGYFGGSPGFSNPFHSIYDGESGDTSSFYFINVGPNYMKDSLLKAFREEYRRKMFLLNNTLLHPENISAMGLHEIRAYADQRFHSVNLQCAQGPYTRPVQPSLLVPQAGGHHFGELVLQASAFAHEFPLLKTHAATRWQIRSETGSYSAPLYSWKSAEDLTSHTLPSGLLHYGQRYFARVIYYDDAGHPSAPSAEVGFTFAYPPAQPSGLQIHEVLAINRAASPVLGAYPDFIELKNTGSTPVSLEGMALTDDPRNPAAFEFPADTTLAPGDRLLLWCGAPAGVAWNLPFELDGSGETLLLLHLEAGGPRVVDAVTFGWQAADLSLARIQGGWTLGRPTPGGENVAEPVTGPGRIFINEWMANPASGQDWVELFNSETAAAGLEGLTLADGRTGAAYTLPPLSFIGPRGHVRLMLGERIPFELNASSDHLLLRQGVQMLDQVIFGPQQRGVSQGRLPDGGLRFAFFPETPSPGEGNWQPLTTVRIHEVLSHASGSKEQAIELFNPGSAPLSIGGWYLSTDPSNLRQYRIPTGTSLPAGGYAAFYRAQFLLSGLALHPFLETRLFLSSADASGQLTGLRTEIRMPPSAPNVSWGRVQTSLGAQWVPLLETSFGRDHASSVAEFRTGTGAPNAPPRVGPLLMTEIMYHPVSGSGTSQTERAEDEFLEIWNASSQPIDLSAWRIMDGIEFEFSAGTVLAANSGAILVSFSPGSSSARNAFIQKYNPPPGSVFLGPFKGRLNNAGERITLAMPLPPQPVVGGGVFVPYMPVDWVVYGDSAPWEDADGNGLSLARLGTTLLGNDPLHWKAEMPSPGSLAARDSDGDGMPDEWEERYQLNRFSALDAQGDEDLDGLSNLQEYLAGTDPRDASSALRITSAARTPTAVHLQISTVAGKRYLVQRSSGLQHDAWVPAGEIQGSQGFSTSFVDAAPDTPAFYRVLLLP